MNARSESEMTSKIPEQHNADRNGKSILYHLQNRRFYIADRSENGYNCVRKNFIIESKSLHKI